MPTTEKKSPALDEANRVREQGKPDIQVVHGPAGIDLPVVGHVSYRSLALYGGLAVAGTVGVLEWPVAAAVGVAYGLAHR